MVPLYAGQPSRVTVDMPETDSLRVDEAAGVSQHFLHNALATIAGLVFDRPDLARDLLVDLSALLRHASRRRFEDVRLDAELRASEAYLRLQAARFGDRLSFRVDVPEPLRDVVVPRLGLQSVLDEVVGRALETSRDPVEVRIAASAGEDSHQPWITVWARGGELGEETRTVLAASDRSCA